ncbi:hypothetical protein CRG98_048406, partial [Punica granatum]
MFEVKGPKLKISPKYTAALLRQGLRISRQQQAKATEERNNGVREEESCDNGVSRPSSPAPAEKKKARGGTWLYISHSPADPDSILSLLFPPVPAQPPCDLVFRFEPLILAIECRDLDSAQFLVSTAISCGFRESGITSANGRRVIVA